MNENPNITRETMQKTPDGTTSPLTLPWPYTPYTHEWPLPNSVGFQGYTEPRIIPIEFLETSERLRLTRHIIVSLSEGEICIVDSPELNIYGEGQDEMQAIRDFKIVLEEEYFSLKKDQENLGPELKRRWNILQQIVQEK